MTYDTLLICLGAQKSGTTWLWRYFREHPQCAAPPLKEVHFFDGRHQRFVDLLHTTERKLAEAQTSEERMHFKAMHAFVDRAASYAAKSERAAEDFEALVASIAKPGTKVVAEFTPANGMLGRATLESLANLPILPKFVMILRDPVDRMWSQIRMLAKKGVTNPSEIRARSIALLDRFVGGEESEVPNRYDYARMLRRARNAIPADRLFVDFFETFMNQSRIDRFCDFLGIDHRPARLDDPRAVGPDIALPAEERARLRKRLNSQYEAVKRDLGALPDAWTKP